MAHESKVARLRELVEQVGNTGMFDAASEDELVEMADLVHVLGVAGALEQRTAFVQVVDVVDRQGGVEVSLPYRYELTLRVTVAGDGLHADGDGAMATAFRLRELVRADDHVVDTAPLPSDVRYLGKVESFPAPLPENGTQS